MRGENKIEEKGKEKKKKRLINWNSVSTSIRFLIPQLAHHNFPETSVPTHRHHRRRNRLQRQPAGVDNLHFRSDRSVGRNKRRTYKVSICQKSTLQSEHDEVKMKEVPSGAT